MIIVEKVKELVKPEYNKLGCWVHSWPHIEDVVENARKIAIGENADVGSCVVAAYCHDLGRIEEEKRKQRGDSPLPHALLSIEPTIKVLQEAGISGAEFNKIVEAVAVHSYRVYEGKNDIARILQDADKMSSGFGPYRILTIIKYYSGKDYVSVEEITNNKNNQERLQELCEASLKQLDGAALEKLKAGIGYVLEWFEMLHTKTAQNLMSGKEGYLKKIRDSLG